MASKDSVPDPSTETAPKPAKRKLSAREKRKLLAERRKQRILNAGDTRLDYVYNKVDKEKLIEKEKEAASKPVPPSHPTDAPSDSPDAERIGDAFGRQSANPFTNPPDDLPSNEDMDHIRTFLSGGMDPRTTSLDPNMGLQGMMDQLFSGGINGRTSKEMERARKRDEVVDRYDQYSHSALCLIFVALLVFLPDGYDPVLLNYSLSSDPWTFFMALEITLFAVVYGLKQYLRGQNAQSQTQFNNGMEGGGQLMAMMGASFLGGGAQINDFIKKWTERITMIWSYIKMIRQLISDLCLILFLWIVFTAIKTLIVS